MIVDLNYSLVFLCMLENYFKNKFLYILLKNIYY